MTSAPGQDRVSPPLRGVVADRVDHDEGERRQDRRLVADPATHGAIEDDRHEHPGHQRGHPERPELVERQGPDRVMG